MQLPKELQFPIQAEVVLRKRAALRRALLDRPGLLPVRIAILGGSTTQEVRSMLEIFLLAEGIRPSFYESAYGAWNEEVMYRSPALWSFQPDIVFVHTTWRNVSRFPDLLLPEAEAEELAGREIGRFEDFWRTIHDALGAVIVQNNFDLPPLRPLGNLESAEPYGRVNFLLRLNAGFAKYAAAHSRIAINDILYLSAQTGLSQWFDSSYWHLYHMAVSPVATVALARNVAAIVKAIYGRTRKCLVLDLDNTLWGGVIGDDGLQNLLLGRDHPVGEAFADFQRYVKGLRARGVLLAVCSKNNPETAREGFSHPDAVLKLEDFSAFKANWNPKPDNIREIAADLNIGLDSLVFVDDNPAERAIVAAQLPEVAVPEVGSDVSRFAEAIEREAYFEAAKIVRDDLDRAAFYGADAQRSSCQAAFGSYEEFLDSLDMTAEIEPFAPVYLERIAQLINKTNQFNLTTRRYTAAEVKAIADDPAALTLYGRLADRFGDNGLVSVVIGRICGQWLEIDLWLMSCRVLKREMEYAMFDALLEECRERGVREILGLYVPSKKNGMVAEHYGGLGFSRLLAEPDGRTLWRYRVPAANSPRAAHIKRTGRRQATRTANA